MVALTVVQLWIVWKVINHDTSIQRIAIWGKGIDKSILRFARTLGTAQTQVFIDTVCSECGDLLPENTTRTHDGKMLCSSCKVKHFAV